ncbi:MAG: type II toxin-antitoxin system VapC family toxin [Bifidobacteriaceae bacterium]|jgi:predicted nucleic acid-binding protein|nr:type II toxin-antitoxin system VapC family toxin [Bifidobacteriaceae bacterium]
MTDAQRWYVDSSVLLRAIVDESRAAKDWLDRASARGDVFVASRLMEVEVRRVSMNAGVDQGLVGQYLDQFVLLTVDDALLAEAIGLGQALGGADAIHVASALRVGAGAVTMVTHDKQMADAAAQLGFAVLDPVGDDPGHGPVG